GIAATAQIREFFYRAGSGFCASGGVIGVQYLEERKRPKHKFVPRLGRFLFIVEISLAFQNQYSRWPAH
ncbi:MAG: hypothetical protein ACKO9A_01310, partial [Alphaproteobacteria bacterium]